MKKGLYLLSFLFINGLVSSAFARTEEAIFAGGNFWTMQKELSQVPGVLRIVTGFDGGVSKNPTYKKVLSGQTPDYRQAVRVIYNPEQVSYSQLVMQFWHLIDPKNAQGQFCDQGLAYRSAIFYQNPQQRQIAMANKQQLIKKFKSISTAILPSTQFYAASGLHQDYAKKHPFKYRWYHYWCGRTEQLKKIWQ